MPREYFDLSRLMPLSFFTIRTACHFAMFLLIFCFLTEVGLEWLGISKSRTTYPVLQSPAAKGSPHVGGVFRWSWGQDDSPAYCLLCPDLWLLGFSWLWVPFQGEAGRLSGDPNCTWRVHTKVSRIWPLNDPKLHVSKIQSSFFLNLCSGRTRTIRQNGLQVVCWQHSCNHQYV